MPKVLAGFVSTVLLRGILKESVIGPPSHQAFIVHLQVVIRSSVWLLLASVLFGCQREYGTQTVTPSPLPQDEQIQVYTNHEPASTYTESQRKLTRTGDDLEQKIVETIASAQHRVDVAVQELRLPKIAAALVDRHRAGVKVRVVLENTYSRPFSRITAEEMAALPEREKDRVEESRRLIDQNGDGQLSQTEIEQGDALVLLDRAGVPRIDDTADGSAGSNLMHHKFLVVDDRTVIVTSANFTTSDIHGDLKRLASRGNANSLLKISSPELASLFTQEFGFLWGDGPGQRPDSRFGVKKPYRPARQIRVGSTAVTVQFSPSPAGVTWKDTTNGLIGKTLSQATQEIQLALFVFSDQKLVNLLEPTHQKGVEIKALIEPGFAYRPYSEALDMLGISLAENCRFEPTNRLWQPAIATVGVPRLPPGDLLHHKLGIVDGQTVIVGSHNWTDAANTGNDETLLVIHSPTVAAHYLREYDRLYTDAILGIPPAIQKKAAMQRRECANVVLRNPAPGSPTRSTARPPIRTARPVAALKFAKPKSRSVQKATAAGNLVNLNQATEAELESLPGVGSGLAKRIIKARQQHRFTALSDLDRVPGVGSKLLKRLQNRVTW